MKLFLRNLDLGEAEALALALEVSADLLVIDERDGSAMANQIGIPTVGVLGLLVEAKLAGLIPAVTPMMDDLRDGLNF